MPNRPARAIAGTRGFRDAVGKHEQRVAGTEFRRVLAKLVLGHIGRKPESDGKVIHLAGLDGPTARAIDEETVVGAADDETIAAGSQERHRGEMPPFLQPGEIGGEHAIRHKIQLSRRDLGAHSQERAHGALGHQHHQSRTKAVAGHVAEQEPAAIAAAIHTR